MVTGGVEGGGVGGEAGGGGGLGVGDGGEERWTGEVKISAGVGIRQLIESISAITYVCTRACTRTCVCVHMCVCVRACVCAWVRACMCISGRVDLELISS